MIEEARERRKKELKRNQDKGKKVNRAVKHQAIKQKEQLQKREKERREYSSEQEMPGICCCSRKKKCLGTSRWPLYLLNCPSLFYSANTK